MEKTGRVLDPVERWSEILFGLIMVLSFTGSISAAEAGREEIRTLLIGALGCNLAWGLVDAVMYVLQRLVERSRGLSLLKAVRASRDPEHGRAALRDALPPLLARLLRPSDFEYLREQVRLLPEGPARVRLRGEDFRGAAGVFLLVFLSTFPVAIPFMVIREQPWLALRLSNGIAIAMLYMGGHALGRYAGLRPVRAGLSMVAIGMVLVLLTLALGG